MVIEESISSAYNGFAITPRIPCDADSGCDVVRIRRNSLDDAESLLSSGIQGCCGFENWHPFDVIAQSIIQSKLAVYLPAVLRKNTESLNVKRPVRLTNSLDKGGWQSKTVRLNSRESWSARSAFNVSSSGSPGPAPTSVTCPVPGRVVLAEFIAVTPNARYVPPAAQCEYRWRW